MEDKSAEELIAEVNRCHSIRKQKLADGLQSDSFTAREVTSEQSTSSETHSNTAIVSKKLKKKSTAQKLKLISKSKRSSLAKDLGKIEPCVLIEEIKGLLTSRFSDNRCLREFVAVLCQNDQPLYIV